MNKEKVDIPMYDAKLSHDATILILKDPAIMNSIRGLLELSLYDVVNIYTENINVAIKNEHLMKDRIAASFILQIFSEGSNEMKAKIIWSALRERSDKTQLENIAFPLYSKIGK